MAYLLKPSGENVDPHLVPTFSLLFRLRRLGWEIVRCCLFRPSPRPVFFWRAFLLRLFGAKIGRNNFIYPSACIWAPWLLETEDIVTIAADTEIYNPGGAVLRHHAIVSQGAFLCGGTHDYNSPSFPMTWGKIEVEAQGWVCARAIVLPGVTIGEGAVLGAGAVTSRDLEPWSVYAGNPARKVGERERASKLPTGN
jgi:putative colanic acid biosynthesis acetyltransferase WcaF